MIDELQNNKWYSIKFSDFEVKRHCGYCGSEAGISIRVSGGDEGFVYVPWNDADAYLRGFVMALGGESGGFELLKGGG